jgi:hypothetical protein
MGLRLDARRPTERRSFEWPQAPNPQAFSARHDDTFSRHTNYRFGIAGGFDVPGTVVPGTAGVLGVAGGVVAAPGPVPGIHGGWITSGVAPFAAVVGAGETADDPGGCVDVVVD